LNLESQQQELKAQMQITLSNMENTLQQSEEQRALAQEELSEKASLLRKVDFTHKTIDLGALEYKAVKEEIYRFMG